MHTHYAHSGFQVAACFSSRPLSRLAGVFLPFPSKGDVEKCLKQVMWWPEYKWCWRASTPDHVDFIRGRGFKWKSACVGLVESLVSSAKVNSYVTDSLKRPWSNSLYFDDTTRKEEQVGGGETEA